MIDGVFLSSLLIVKYYFKLLMTAKFNDFGLKIVYAGIRHR